MTTRNVKRTAFLAVLACSVFAAGCGLVGTAVSKALRPGPAAGTYPDEIAGLKLHDKPQSEEYLYQPTETSEFKAYYSNGSKTVTLKEFVFKNVQDATTTLDSHDPLAGTAAVTTPTRHVSYRDKVVVVEFVAGNTLVGIEAPDMDTAMQFENAFPYKAFGAETPPTRSASDYGEQTYDVMSLYEQIQDDPKAAAAKYDGKTLLMRGQVFMEGVLSKDNQMMVTFGNPNSKDPKKVLELVVVGFAKSEQDKISKLKMSDYVTFRGKVKVDTAEKDLSVDNATVEDSK